MMKVQWVSHKGKKILFTDYEGTKTQEEMIVILNESIQIAKKTPGTILGLVNIRDSAVGPDYMKEAKEQGKALAHKREKSAIIGVTGLKGMLLKGFNLFTGSTLKSFNTKEEALDYLVS